MLSRSRSRSPIPPTAATAISINALRDAIKSFQNCLEPDQKARLEAIKAVPDAHAVAQFTYQLDQENAKRKSRCVAARISPLLDSVQQFSGIVETFVSSNPHIAALVWGSVKLVLQIASNFTTYFDNLSALLMTIGKRCPKFQEYQKLYRDSTDLQKVLCDFYSVVVRCCEQAIIVLRRPGYIQLLKSVTSSFNVDFAPIITQIDRHSEEVKETIRLAEAKLNVAERQDQRTEREAAEKYRLSSMLYRKEREKIEADWAAQMQLEKRKIRQASKLEQFSDYNHKIAYWKARTRRHGSTGQWLTQTDEFKQWMTGSVPSVFWFTGILGSGKTVTTAFVVEQLSAKSMQGSEKLVYFFCQYDNETSLKATTILRSIIRQLLNQDDRIFTEHQSKIDALLDNLYDLGLLEVLLSDVVNCLQSVVVIIDGVNECSEPEMKLLLKTLSKLRKSCGLKLYLAGDDRITSMIMLFLEPSFVVNTHTPEAGTDLQELIHQLVSARREDGDLKTGDPSLYQDIVDILCTASQGMVLWVKFQLEEICSQKTDEDIRRALDHLPKDLSETYNRLLSRIVDEGSEEVCKKVFHFMAAAKKPLSPEELGEAISVVPCQPYFMPERLLNDSDGIVRWCHGLVAFDELDENLQFTHSSVKDFLCGLATEQSTLPGFHFQQDEADRQFGECFSFLGILPSLANQSKSSWYEALLALEHHDLDEALRGAGTRWLEKLTMTERLIMLAKVVETDHIGLLKVKTVLVELRLDPYREFVDHGKPTTLLEKLLRDEDTENLRAVCKAMVASNTSFERKLGLTGRTALHVAAILRRYIAVGILLDHGADVDAIDDDGRTALHLAIKGDASTTDNSDVLNSVSQLLIAGASLDVRDLQGRVALDYASRDFKRPLREQFKTYRIFLDTNKERSRPKITTPWPL
ncbi:hypothetical protein KCU98_g2699, partial [Aureobasidium melanogenum]